MASDSDTPPGSGKQGTGENESEDRLSDLRVTAWFLSTFLLVGILVVSIQNAGAKMPSVLWALAWLAVGDVIGFLFGIPRVLQQADVKPAVSPQSDATRAATSPTDDQAASYRQQVNTNLEQISDWLTKIIVGIGLVELRRLPELMVRVSGFMAAGLGTAPQAQVLAAGIVIYFSILGFLSGYLLTRIYLSGAFARADTGNVLVRGIATPIGKLFEQLYKAVTELQGLMTTKGVQPAESGEQATRELKMGLKIRSVLWVDDYPENNSLMISEMKSRGMAVVLAKSTQEAMSKFRPGRFDTVITDMGRDVDGPKAGVELTRQIRMIDTEVPIDIYCSRESIQRYGGEATNAGANEVTSSEIRLREMLQLYP
jgi:CheY-like chemotaxis protein